MDVIFPLVMTYTVQKSGAILDALPGMSFSLNLLWRKGFKVANLPRSVALQVHRYMTLVQAKNEIPSETSISIVGGMSRTLFVGKKVLPEKSTLC